jgi:hypothetical protein
MFANPANLFVGTDLTSDYNNVRIVDMSLTDNSDNVRMKMKYKMGTQIGFANEIAIGY